MIRMLIIGYVFAIRSERQLRPHGKMFLVETTEMVGCGHVSGLLLRFT